MSEVVEFQKKQIKFWIENGLDKQSPGTFKVMQENLEILQRTTGDDSNEDANGKH